MVASSLLRMAFEGDLIKADFFDEPLHLAVIQRELPAIMKLVGKSREKIGWRDRRYHQTPIITACMVNYCDSHLDTVALLLKYGADVLDEDRQRNTALVYTVKGKNHKTFVELCKFNVNLNFRHPLNKKTIFYEAVYNKDYILVKELLKKGCTIYSENVNNPIFLLTRDSNVNQTDYRNYLKIINFFFNYTDVQILNDNNQNIITISKSIIFTKKYIKFIAKLKAFEAVIKPFTTESIEKNPENKKFFKSCCQELELAKNTKIKNCWISYLHILKANNIQLKNYAGNKNFKKNVEATNYLKVFKNYGTSMKKKINKAIVMNLVFENCESALSDVCPIFNVKHLIIKNILESLNRQDLEKISGMKNSKL